VGLLGLNDVTAAADNDDDDDGSGGISISAMMCIFSVIG